MMCGLLGCVRRVIADHIAAVTGLSPMSVLPAAALADAEADRDIWEPDELWESQIVPSPGRVPPKPGGGHPE